MPKHESPYLIRDAETLSRWDRLTVKLQRISSFDLMQRASATFAAQLQRDFPLTRYPRVDVLVGPGNNGGDGCCVAVVLAQAGYAVRVFDHLPPGAHRRGDAAEAWEVLAQAQGISTVTEETYLPDADTTLIVDALFGVGLSRPVEGAFAKTLDTLSVLDLPIVAVDVPSGQDVSGAHPEWNCVRATTTYTFAALKQSALLPDTGPSWGTVVLLDIGLVDPAADPELQRALIEPVRVLTQGSIAALLRPRPRFTHKGTWGHVLVVAGSRGHAGAALLCGRGAYRGGAGLVTFYAPSRLEPILQAGLPEAMCLHDPDPDFLSVAPDIEAYDCIVFGPGVGQRDSVLRVLTELIDLCRATDKPLVIDADGLNLLAANPELWARLPPKLVLTPHPGEFARLVAEQTGGLVRQTRAIEFARQTLGPEGVLVLKDQYTLIAAGDGRAAVNFFEGNPGMGTGGMGDTLAGLLGARLAAGGEAYQAACLAVAIHGRAGDLAREHFGETGLLAGDVAELLGRATASFLAASDASTYAEST